MEIARLLDRFDNGHLNGLHQRSSPWREFVSNIRNARATGRSITTLLSIV
jgi:hypothetical protein